MVIVRNHSKGSQQSEIMTTASDLVTTAAAYASDTNAVKYLLDQVKVLSTNPSYNSLLIPEEENLIFDIYFKLEHYLISVDPIRNFNKEDLRNKASKSLRSRLEAYESQPNEPT